MAERREILNASSVAGKVMATKSETHERILRKATELLQRFGPRKTAVADIAHELEMSPANIYKFFPSKRALIDAVAERRLMMLRQDLVAVIRSEKTAFERIEDLVRAVATSFQTMFEENELLEIELTRDLLEIEAMGRAKKWQCLEEFHAFLRSALTTLVRAGVEAGEMHVADPAETAEALFDCLIWVIEPLLLLREPKAVSARRLERQFRLLARALA
jgi:AcrR family transcriptional regulator